MRLFNGCEKNSKPIGKQQEHVTKLWDILSPHSRDAVKRARKGAKE